MNNYFIQGYPKCGKSKAIEKYMESNYENSIYVGTLWKDYRTLEIIRNHQMRRKDNFWILFEVGKKILNDIDEILRIVNQNSKIPVLLDNPTTMVLNYCSSIDEFNSFSEILLVGLLMKLVKVKNDFYMIDNIVEESHIYYQRVNQFQKEYLKLMNYDF